MATLAYETPKHGALSRRGKGSLAVAASLLLPGLGHWITNDRRRAVRWFAVLVLWSAVTVLCMSIPAAFPILLVIFPLGVIAQVLMWIDAYRRGRSSNARMLGHPAARYVVALAIAAIAVFIAPTAYLAYPLRRYIVEAFVMPTAAMSPTIQPGDRFVVHKQRPFRRFDIVAITGGDARFPDAIYAERVVGFPNETIELTDNVDVRVNGHLLSSPAGLVYVSKEGPRTLTRIDGRYANGVAGNPIHLGADEYFFLGDNSPTSGDSRFWLHSVDGHQAGTLSRNHIKGVATWTYWPPSRCKKLY